MYVERCLGIRCVTTTSAPSAVSSASGVAVNATAGPESAFSSFASILRDSRPGMFSQICIPLRSSKRLGKAPPSCNFHGHTHFGGCASSALFLRALRTLSPTSFHIGANVGKKPKWVPCPVCTQPSPKNGRCPHCNSNHDPKALEYQLETKGVGIHGWSTQKGKN